MPRLRRVDCAQAGIRRLRRGRGFSYRRPDGTPITDPVTVQRIADLAIPPAWTEVWICPWPNGHIQAVGTDAAGRRQYRYHDQWRLQRDLEKHERILEFAATLPAVRERVQRDLTDHGLGREQVLAAAIRLLDLGFFRIGGEEYAETNGSYGLATMRREHVRVDGGGVIRFDYVAKGGKRRVQAIADPAVCAVVRELKRRRSGGPELLAYRQGRRWVDVRSEDINEHLQALTGLDCSAKDFRTWHGTVLCAVGLAVSAHVPPSEPARKRAVSRAVQEVAHYLGNTPAVCRASYINPRVIDLYNDGMTIHRDLERLGADTKFGELATQGAVEAAVLRLLSEPVSRQQAS